MSFPGLTDVDPALRLFQAVYLIGLLAIYWYDIIPTVISIESKVSEKNTVLNKTANLIKRILDSQPADVVKIINEDHAP